MLKIYYTRLTDWADKPDGFFYPDVDEDTVKAVQNFRNSLVRRTKLLGESMTRTLLHTYWGLEKGSYRLAKGEHGKPFVAGASVPAYFNLSHSGDYVVCAVSDTEIGVDIERVGTARMNVARRFFHPAELRELEEIHAGQQDDLFFTYWTVKEGFLKYAGTGLSLPLSSFQVVVGEQSICILGECGYGKVYVHPCEIDRRYKCFVCSGEDETPELFYWKG